MKYIIKLEISNSVNDDITIYWGIFNNIQDKESFIGSHNKDMQEWNHNTPGARSFRYYSYTEYTEEQILNTPFEDLKGMSLMQFKSLM